MTNVNEYLRERENTYFRRYTRLGQYIAHNLTSDRLQEAIKTAEACRANYKDYSKLRQDNAGINDKVYIDNLLKKYSI